MLNVFRGSLVLGILMFAIPQVGESCHRCKVGCKSCVTCSLPMANCTCPTVEVIPQSAVQTTVNKVVETRFCPKPIVTQRQVVETHYRNETYKECVPVQAFDNVTVDEGHYVQVWVPKLVCKQVPKTVMQERTACRTVPFQVCKTVPEVSTTMVPVQTVRYVTTQTPVTPAAPPTCVPGLNGAPPATTAAPFPAVSAYPLPPASYAAAPNPYAASGTAPAGQLPVPQTAANVGQFPESQMTANPVAGFAEDDARLGDFRLAQPQGGVQPADAGPFVPAPSAASVWRTPRGTVTR